MCERPLLCLLDRKRCFVCSRTRTSAVLEVSRETFLDIAASIPESNKWRVDGDLIDTADLKIKSAKPEFVPPDLKTAIEYLESEVVRLKHENDDLRQRL